MCQTRIRSSRLSKKVFKVWLTRCVIQYLGKIFIQNKMTTINFFENKKFAFALSIFVILIHQLIFQKIIPNAQGFLGHDYDYVIPYFIFGKFWYINNYFSIPWFTPSFCCGLPFYSDPQSMFYSLPQIIFLIFDDPIFCIKFVFFYFL